MRSQRRPLSLTATIRRALSDYNWHTQGELLALGVHRVRPEIAVRYWRRRKHEHDQPLEEQIRIGAMGIVGQIISKLGVETSHGPGQVRSYRLIPSESRTAQCLQCHRSFERGFKHRRFCSPNCARLNLNARRMARYHQNKQEAVS